MRVPGRTHAVTPLYLEDVLDLTAHKVRAGADWARKPQKGGGGAPGGGGGMRGGGGGGMGGGDVKPGDWACPGCGANANCEQSAVVRGRARSGAARAVARSAAVDGEGGRAATGLFLYLDDAGRRASACVCSLLVRAFVGLA